MLVFVKRDGRQSVDAVLVLSSLVVIVACGCRCACGWAIGKAWIRVG
jgi:hypothetical protein